MKRNMIDEETGVAMDIIQCGFAHIRPLERGSGKAGGDVHFAASPKLEAG